MKSKNQYLFQKKNVCLADFNGWTTMVLKMRALMLPVKQFKLVPMKHRLLIITLMMDQLMLCNSLQENSTHQQPSYQNLNDCLKLHNWHRSRVYLLKMKAHQKRLWNRKKVG